MLCWGGQRQRGWRKAMGEGEGKDRSHDTMRNHGGVTEPPYTQVGAMLIFQDGRTLVVTYLPWCKKSRVVEALIGFGHLWSIPVP